MANLGEIVCPRRAFKIIFTTQVIRDTWVNEIAEIDNLFVFFCDKNGNKNPKKSNVAILKHLNHMLNLVRNPEYQ